MYNIIRDNKENITWELKYGTSTSESACQRTKHGSDRTSSTFDASKPYIINDGVLNDPSTNANWIKNSTTMTIIFALEYTDNTVKIYELSAGEREGFSRIPSQIRYSAKIQTNNIIPGVTVT